MSKTSKDLKGYIKTESIMLVVFIAIAVGFVGGVAYSAYRTSSQTTNPMPATSNAPPLDDQQRAQLADLIKRTESNPQDVAVSNLIELFTLGHFTRRGLVRSYLRRPS